MSYAYIANKPTLLEYLKQETTKGSINLMIDSGAFTKLNSKAAMSHVNVDDYCTFLKQYAQYSEKYVMLDVIGNTPQSIANYQKMLSKGLNPMYVVTFADNDWRMINEAVDRQSDICVAGGAIKQKCDWNIKRYQDVFFNTNKKARMHGLGFFTFPKMLQCHLASIDASTWKTAPASFGQGVYFDGKQTYRIAAMDIFAHKRTFPKPVLELFKEYGVSAKQYADKNNHSKSANIEAYMTTVCAIKMQKYCKRHGLDYFLACGCLEDVKTLVYVNENIHNMTYERYLHYVNS